MAGITTPKGGGELSATVKGDWDIQDKTGHTMIPPGTPANFAIQNVRGPIYVQVLRLRNGQWELVHKSHPIDSDRSLIFKENGGLVLAKYGTIRVPE